MPKNLYRRGATWWGRVKISGKDYRRSLRTSDRTEATRRLKAWREELTAETRFGLVKHSWQDAVLKWTTEVMPQAVKSSTATRYLVSLRQVDPLLRDLDVRSIGRAELAKVAGRQGPTNATRRRDITAIMSVLYACESWGWIDEAPSPKPALRTIRERRDPIALPPDDEVEALIKACPGNLARLVALLRHSGLRLEEAGGLEWRQVRLRQREIILDRTKTDRPRAVPLDDQAEGTLRGTVRHVKSPWVFWHGSAGLRYANLSSRLLAVRRRLGIAWKAHDLRHLYAVEYLRQGGSIYDLQRILGHASIKTTEIYLAYLTPAQQRVAMRTGS